MKFHIKDESFHGLIAALHQLAAKINALKRSLKKGTGTVNGER